MKYLKLFEDIDWEEDIEEEDDSIDNSDDIYNFMKKIFINRFDIDIDDKDWDDTLDEIGLDELDVVEVVMDTESALGISITDEVLDRMSKLTLRDYMEIVKIMKND